MSLDLYAKIEPYLGFEKEVGELHDIFLEKLLNLGAKKVLDIGCGSGDFLVKAKKAGIEIEGIDLSFNMVQNALKKGVNAYHKDLCEVDDKYDAAVAIFDVLNYLNSENFKKFLCCVDNVLVKNGHFICDINTLYGFEEIAQGVVAIDKDNTFISIEAEFENKELRTKIVMFEKGDNGCYKKSRGEIVQYYHDIDSLKSCKGLKLTDMDFIALFSDISDKVILTYEKV
ncbi:class I SAM-dependent DNA methyltransferase [Nitrosophilus labii]|uniref:class I SAM-dependent DNA methyltransferase n=1 Tax=Nitrosophilus labii TaxID=2706014 RepID=UPI0016572BCD|nr:class I SAM-dependent methyltransferase [Nitrosophilus labii]